MNKFHSPECADYKSVAAKIKEIAGKIREGTPLQQADELIRNKHYSEDRLRIERLSGDKLPMDQCYINLAIVEQSGQDAGRSKEGDATASPFSLFARQKVETPDKTIQVELFTLFNIRKGPGGETRPRRILIRGRAGVGKTTLCKKIVYEFTQDTWSEWRKLFDRVLWVPLRNLKLPERRQVPAYNFEHLFRHEYFSLPNNRPDLAEALSDALKTKSNKTLFLLDGLDEVSQDLGGADDMSRFLKELLKQPNVIITSRPSAKPPPDLDLELETVGFYLDQVKAYLDADPKIKPRADKVQSFLQKHWLLQGLVRIPIQLDALCYTWEDFDSGTAPDTMTGIYQAIEQKLWKKDAVRLDKMSKGDARSARPAEIERSVQTVIALLECLAFNGLHSDVIDFTPGHRDKIVNLFPPSNLTLDETLARLSFLRTSDSSSRVEDRNYHFIHLTFQEYFAARYFVRQWKKGGQLQFLALSSKETEIKPIPPAEFLRKHKYTARYDIFWRFVAGLLDAEGQACRFIDVIEQEPLDLLGPTHQRLVMHCLSEVPIRKDREERLSKWLRIRKDLEERLSKWLLFECEFSQSADLASEVEFPQQALSNALLESTGDVRITILQSLAKRVTIPPSTASCLKDEDSGVREAAVRALGGRSDLPEEILKAVAARLEDKDEDVREAAVRALGVRSDLPKEILKAVAARLKDKDEDMREAAVRALGVRSDLPEEILKAVAARLKDKDEDMREAAVRALGVRSDLPKEILKAVAARLEDKDEDVREAAVRALGVRLDLPEETLKAVAAWLEDEVWHVRRAAVWALGGRLDLPKEILKVVAARLEDKDEDVREAAVRALGGRLDLPEETLKAAAALLEDEVWHVREAAVVVLGGRLDLPEETLKAVAARLEDKDEDVREAAVVVLGGRSDLPEEILKAAAARLEDEDSGVRRAAVEALGVRLDLPEETLKAVAARLEDKDEDMRWAAIWALGGQSDLPKEILKAVAALLEDKVWHVQEAAVEALGGRSDLPKETLKAVAARLEDKVWHVRRAAVRALGRRSDLPKEILKAVAARLEDKDEDVREAAVRALGMRSDLPKETLKAVAARLEDEDENIREAAVEALGGRSDLPEETLKAVAARLEDSDVRRVAEAVLRRHEEFFYLTLLKGAHVTSLYGILLRRSFKEQLSCYAEDGNFCVNMPEAIKRISLDTQHDVTAMINKARPTNFPSTSGR
ncbi:hypothetical protein NW754_009517 [Fusarium falciforme]|nr:hypothetical protein NW754_009517 [Fusarium falciforme]